MNFDLIVACGATLILYFCWKNLLHWSPRVLWHTWSIPGFPGYPILGNAIHFIGSPEFVWSQMRKSATKYTRMYKITGLNMTNVYLSDPQDVQHILSKPNNLKKGIVYQWIKCWLGNGLLTSDGIFWKRRRKIFNFAFASDLIRGFVPDFDAESENSINELQSLNLDEPVNVIPITLKHGLFSLEKTIIGNNVALNPEGIHNYDKGVAEFAGVIVKRLVSPWLIYDWSFWISPISFKLRRLTKELHQFTRHILDARLESWDAAIENTKNKKLPLLDLLISQMKTEGNIDNQGICEELDTFIFAGHDTTSVVTGLTLMLLANNPECQDRVFEEQSSLDKRLSAYDSLHQMPYLDRCIKESLRLYPGAPIVGRELDTDVHLDDGMILPASLFIWISIFDIHRNPKYWTEPDKFDPDRFLPENSVGRHTYAYIPFSAGSRNCIGQRFAVLQIKSIVSKICQNFVLEPIDTPETVVFRTDFVTRPSKPLLVKFIRRQN